MRGHAHRSPADRALADKRTFLATFELPERFRRLVLEPGDRHIEYCPVLGIDDPGPELVFVSTYEQAALRHQRDTAFPLGAR